VRCFILKTKSKAAVFLMELIIGIAVFAVCAAVSIRIIAVSHTIAINAVDMRHALLMAENAAESHKEFGGDFGEVARLLDGAFDGTTLTIFYCGDWTSVDEAGAEFILTAVRSEDNGVVFADISVTRVVNDDELIAFTAAVRGNIQ